MGWAIVSLLLAFVALGLILIGRLPRRLWELVGAALLVGLAGYAWQGRPAVPGSPRDPAQTSLPFDEDLAKLRDAFGGRYGAAAQWITLSDGFARQGRTQDAANILNSGLRAHPGSAELWVALANALVSHSRGISPAAEYSYNQAMRLAPHSSSAPYFYGLALARAGRFAEARTIWSRLADRVPKQSPLHADLERSLAQLDLLLEGQVSRP